MFGRGSTKKQNQRARDYVVHHAARLGWLPPTDDQQALVVLATRVWELLVPERPVDPRELDRTRLRDVNRMAENTFVWLGAATGFIGHRYGGPSGELRDARAETEKCDPYGTAQVLFVLKDPWKTDDWLEELEDVRWMFLLALSLHAETIGQVAEAFDALVAA